MHTALKILVPLLILPGLAFPVLADNGNRYRAEIILLERLADPGIRERMESRHPEAASTDLKILWRLDRDGNRQSDLDLVPQGQLHLGEAARRLENSGRFRVLFSAGWVQAFPPDYDGEPMGIAVGDYLEAAGHRAIEGRIEIDRQRFLHVRADINHWREGESTGARARSQRGDGNDNPEPAPAEAGDTELAPVTTSAADQPGNRELITWIRETRRMRSEEIHFLDSPSIGVLVYFEPLKDKAAPVTGDETTTPATVSGPAQ